MIIKEKKMRKKYIIEYKKDGIYCKKEIVANENELNDVINALRTSKCQIICAIEIDGKNKNYIVF